MYSLPTLIDINQSKSFKKNSIRKHFFWNKTSEIITKVYLKHHTLIITLLDLFLLKDVKLEKYYPFRFVQVFTIAFFKFKYYFYDTWK